ncbi:MAG: hypothetical protein CVV64_01635 [Candidatus Wallbacteria bacterium HGW-Wallbacteria-1]|jgi:KDO2-lipid IV(A) lauroyltransferase|uniref:Lipid A biosynthesis acyltransferase n=1 Tax=Candidatus Wallbacteria bacterium HGW-Wallbacteria-1 TaxID=2013854 RepID=A0A2N1PV02_9BACT|nr:MAG: hypothetical protein CVV64_01635 [Candidatus Wallbacteria bacterium HGW-Wallbacteria-1]
MDLPVRLIRRAVLLVCKAMYQLQKRDPGHLVTLGSITGDLIFHFLRKRRMVVIANLRNTIGEDWSPARTRQVARDVYRNLATNLFEFMALPFHDRDSLNSIVTSTGMERYDEYLSGGKGILLLTAHYGNWEYLGAWLGLNGYPLRAVNKRQKGIFADFVIWFRQRAGVKLLFKGAVLKSAVTCIRDGAILGLLADQGGGKLVRFMGRKTSLPYGAALFSGKLKAPVIPTFIRRIEDGRHQVFTLPEIKMEFTGDRERDLQENTQKVADVLQQVIESCPEQWFWLHKMWKDVSRGLA